MNFRMSLLSKPDNMSNTGNMSNFSKPSNLGNLNNMGKLSNLSKPSKPDIIICGLFYEITLSLKETAYINRAAQAIREERIRAQCTCLAFAACLILGDE